MWVVELVDDIRIQVRKAPKRDLLITAGALIGLATILGAGGWWLVLTGTYAVDYALEKGLDTRIGGNTGTMALYWGIAGWALVSLAVLFASMGLGLLAGVMFKKRKP